MKKIIFLLIVLSGMILASCVGKTTSSFQPTKVSSPFKSSDGYILQFGEDFKTGMNSVSDFGISVVIAVDTSGSMSDSPKSGGEAKYKQASKALSTIANYLESMTKKQKDLKIQVAIIKFSSSVKTVLPITVLNESGLAALHKATDPDYFLPDGNTAIGRAIESASEILAQSGTILNSIIIVSDGENTTGIDPEDAIKALYSDRNSATTVDYKIFTSSQLLSFIGFDINSNKFDIFHQLGARVMRADNQVELEGSLKGILEADITKLESK